MSTLTHEELRRYQRHLVLPEIGAAGQARLKAARVLLIGAGGLGAPIATYLAAAGVGRIGIVEDDCVDLTNIHRQIVYTERDVGTPKLAATVLRLQAINSHITIVPHAARFNAENALLLAAGYDVLIDGSDNFPTRYLANDAAVLLKKPLIYGGVLQFEGQATVFDATRGPCYRCIFPTPPATGTTLNCSEGGVLGMVPGLIGMIQATETIKYLLHIGDSLVGRLLLFDALACRFRELRIAKDPQCAICGSHPTITAPTAETMVCADDAQWEILPHELHARIAQGAPMTLIDVREPFEYAICHLPGSMLMPLSCISARQQELDRHAEIVLICHHGIRSMNALRQLRAAGFQRLKSLHGGLAAWADEIDPTMPTY